MGGEGQFLAAYVVAAWVGAFFHMPAWLHIPFTFIAAAMAGALWGVIPGILKAKLGIHEVISTIMFNYIALQGSIIVIREFLMPKGGYIPASPMIQPTAQLPRLVDMTRFNASFFVALAVAGFIGWILWRTITGYEVRAVGFNPHAAEYGGINVAKNIVLAMMVSGALAGLAGATQVMGLEYRAYQPFGLLGLGFTGIAVALLGKNHPAGIILGALLFGVLQRGANSMQSMAGVPKEVILIIQAFIIFFVASDYALKKIHRRLKMKKGVA
jgi:simple sugar transport system permease protein